MYINPNTMKIVWTIELGNTYLKNKDMGNFHPPNRRREG
jgi:hypothetical protein